jgi:hypothetical protein
MRTHIPKCLLVLLLLLMPSLLPAQDLEPRRWSHLPVGLNVIGIGTGRTDGEIFLDPVLRIEDATYELYPLGVSYVRTVELAGRSSRIDLIVPWANGRWEGLLDGEYASVRRHGFADPRLRFSMNLYGAPALRGKDYLQYVREHPVNTTVGAGVELVLPLGEYMSERLINLGNNRYVIRPQLGVLHQRGKWQYELTGSVFLYEDNDEFWQGTYLEQDPLWFLQAHLIYSFRPGWWASLSGGYGHGGRQHVNGVAKDNDARNAYWSVSFGFPLSPRQAMKIAWFSGETHISAGNDFDALLVAWSVNWGR